MTDPVPPHQHAWSHGSARVCVHCGIADPDHIAPTTASRLRRDRVPVTVADLEWLFDQVTATPDTVARVDRIRAAAGLAPQ